MFDTTRVQLSADQLRLKPNVHLNVVMPIALFIILRHTGFYNFTFEDGALPRWNKRYRSNGHPNDP